jgi:hypothetical protein
MCHHYCLLRADKAIERCIITAVSETDFVKVFGCRPPTSGHAKAVRSAVNLNCSTVISWFRNCFERVSVTRFCFERVSFG